MAHDQLVLYKCHLFVILFIFVISRASYVHIFCGFISSAVWGFSKIFPSPLGAGS